MALLGLGDGWIFLPFPSLPLVYFQNTFSHIRGIGYFAKFNIFKKGVLKRIPQAVS